MCSDCWPSNSLPSRQMICKWSMLGASTFIYTGETWSSAGLLGVLNPVHSVGVLCLGLLEVLIQVDQLWIRRHEPQPYKCNSDPLGRSTKNDHTTPAQPECAFHASILCYSLFCPSPARCNLSTLLPLSTSSYCVLNLSSHLWANFPMCS